MTLEEAKKAIDGFKAEGRTDEEIVATLYLMFQDDKLNVEELGNLVGLVGYELTEEFLNMSPEDQKTKVFEEEGDEETGKEEGGAPSETASDGTPKEEENPATNEPGESEEEQERKARKLFGLDSK